MSVDIVITNAGRAAIVNAQNNGTAPVTIAQFGMSQTAVTPAATATTLPGEFKRLAALSGEVVADDTIHVTMTDESADEYALRSFALYLSDGTLFAIYGQAAAVYNKVASSIGGISLDIIFADISAASLSFGNANFTNPPATTERQGVVELATVEEQKAGKDATRAVTPSGAKQSVFDWIGYYPVNKAGDTVTGTLSFGDSFYSAYRDAVGNPFLRFDQNDSLAYDRANDALNIFIGGTRRAVFSSDGYLNMQGGFAVGNYLVWHYGNDGAGSGLDADLLDGRHGAAFALLDGTASFTGSIKAGTQNGLLMRTSAGTVPTLIHRTDSSAYYMLLSAPSADFSTTYNDLRPFTVNLNTGRISSYNGQDFYGGTAVRNSLTLDGYGVWTSGNDGAGSGLDADLLDGQDGSYYANVIARIGYTPVNKGGDSITAKISYVVSDSTAMAARSGDSSSPLEVRGNGVGPAIMTFHRPNSYATFFGFDTDNQLKFGGWSAGATANLIWHSGNDGSGSGLDADTVDGIHASSFARVDVGGGASFAGGVTAPYLRSTGTMNVDSALGVGGTIQANYQNGILLKPSATNAATVIHRNDGSIYYLLLSNPGAAITENWNALRPFQVNLTSGRIASANGQDFSGGMTVSGSITFNGAGVWTSGNDGAGSGLDADLLDGLQGSQFMRNFVGSWVTSEDGVARFHFINGGATYTRVNGGCYWQNRQDQNVASIDESGTLWLNGEVNALRFRARSNGDGYALAVGDDAWIGDVNWTNGIGIRGQQDGNAGFVTFGTSGLGLGCNAGDSTLRYGGMPIWHSGNDGSGSGLDADLLDGWQLQDILPSGSLAATGYTRLPNGLIMQWGTITCGNNSYGSLTFPIQFPNACFHIHSGVATEVGNGDAQANCPLPYSVTRLGASFWNAAPQATAWWMAIGN